MPVGTRLRKGVEFCGRDHSRRVRGKQARHEARWRGLRTMREDLKNEEGEGCLEDKGKIKDSVCRLEVAETTSGRREGESVGRDGRRTESNFGWEKWKSGKEEEEDGGREEQTDHHNV